MSQEPFRSAIPLPGQSSKSLLLIVLLADTPLPLVKAAHGNYHDIFTSLFEHSVQLHASQIKLGSKTTSGTQSEAVLTVESYDAVQGQYPTEDRVKEAHGVLITGSASSAYETFDWITKLVGYTASLPKINPQIRLIGICFGHQIIARAFGSTVERNSKGWEVGVRVMDLTEYGSSIFGGERLPTAVWDLLVEPSRRHHPHIDIPQAIHQMHRDHVPSLPSGFELLGSTPMCSIHGMVKYFSSAPSPPSANLGDIEVLTLQGHPEFSPDIVLKVIEVRAERGVFDPEMAEKSRAHARESDEGVRIGEVVLRIIGL
ncbi:BZ3500_MvSof-1268-A1-R1_Chr4-2g07045 [Microbotryum saponariae]|uniref:BZ3500_MvSof-1268-A1-R1_Chr4-2g07045 protein n=1 Tax=Microbotryum saponariae TaxID=289078 RepID=A0A2X0MWR5_9BASI|nr:BZ3500_MvSof-1268-A1-R1_Chr4-2g07045 [Microbotryum saponariae]SDA06710.1 BZ3501_MvSof-1269-A2-R1_Chr4-2g06756 [Microbotryum saponariae]